jgi:hypothetical protein
MLGFVYLGAMDVKRMLACGFAAWVMQAQAQQHSHNGWTLPVKDTLMVLVIFAEVEYDTLAHLDQLPHGTADWKPGQLPVYASQLFHHTYVDQPQALLTRYYRESSLGNFEVLGDYYPEVITVKYSEFIIGGQTVLHKRISEQLAAREPWSTSTGMSLKAFDRLGRARGRGLPIPASGPDFDGVDHCMVIVRNFHLLPKGNGMASGSSFSVIGGKPTDTYSIFSGGHDLPFGILKHELNHLFLGGNNFHSGGGNSARFMSYLLSVQGGWSMMGAANSSLSTCNGWDRYRLGWGQKDSPWLITATKPNGQRCNGDLDALQQEHSGEYLLRDFVTTGDVIRIKLPYMAEAGFQQWLWIENHGTEAINGSPFDKYQLEHYDCTSYAVPGLYMAIQIDAEQKEDRDVFNNVLADYWMPLPANGRYDFVWSEEPVALEPCVNDQHYRWYELRPELENPLTGNHEQELSYAPLKDHKGPLLAAQHIPTMVRKVGETYQRLNFMGHASHAYRLDGNAGIGLGSNPASASVLTYVNSRLPRKPDARDQRQVYLNGIAVRILEHMPDGTIRIRVDFDDHVLAENRRWCGPIALSNHHLNGPDLWVKARLTLDRGRTATRLDQPDSTRMGWLYNDTTYLRVQQGATLRNSGTLWLANGSTLELAPGATLDMQRRSTIVLKSGSALVLQPGAVVSGKGRIKAAAATKVLYSDTEQYNALRKRISSKRRLLLRTGQ